MFLLFLVTLWAKCEGVMHVYENNEALSSKTKWALTHCWSIIMHFIDFLCRTDFYVISCAISSHDSLASKRAFCVLTSLISCSQRSWIGLYS